MKKSVLFVAIALQLQSCSYSYPVLAKVIGGRLAFVSGDPNYDCISSISVTATGPRAADPAIENLRDPSAKGAAIDSARIAWRADAGVWTCTAHYPVFYGYAVEGMPNLVEPKQLRVGEPYSIGVMGHGSGGGGCFLITESRAVENRPEADCSIVESEMSLAPVQAAGTVSPVRARAMPASLIRAGDVPQSALPAKGERAVRFVLDVGTDGKASGCTVLKSSGSAILDSATCRIMQERAQYTAASAPTGVPMSSRIEQEVKWTHSGVKPAPPPPPAGWRFELAVWEERTNTVHTVRTFDSVQECRAELGRIAAEGPSVSTAAFCFDEPPIQSTST